MTGYTRRLYDKYYGMLIYTYLSLPLSSFALVVKIGLGCYFFLSPGILISLWPFSMGAFILRHLCASSHAVDFTGSNDHINTKQWRQELDFHIRRFLSFMCSEDYMGCGKIIHACTSIRAELSGATCW